MSRMMEDNNKNQKKQELENAGRNTAHAAGKAAASYMGGTVGNIAYDKFSQTRLGQGIEQGVGKVISKVPVVNKINKKANDVGAVDAVNRVSDLSTGRVKNAMRPKRKNNNIRKSNNTSGNSNPIPQALQNKNHNQSVRNRFLGANTQSGSSEETENPENISEEVSENTSPNLIGSKTGMMLFRKLLPYLIVIVPIFIVLVLLIIVFGDFLGMVSSFFSIDSHKTDNPEYLYNESLNKQLQEEIDYNNAIVGSKDGSVKGIVQIYQEKYGVTLDWHLLHAVISYRYTMEDESKLYTDKDDIDISDEELENRLEELEKEEIEGEDDNTSENTSSIDYSAAKKKIETVAALMVTKNSDGTYSTDNTIGGNFYNRLIDSSFLKSYYKKFLKNNDYETRKKLVDEIFEYVEIAKSLMDDPIASSFVSETAIVYLQTCDTPYKKFTINGRLVYDNPLTNEGSKYPTYLSMYDYVKGVLMSEIGTSWFTEELREMVKVQAILALNFIIGDSSSGFDLKSGEMYFPTQTCRQVTCDPTYGCISIEGKGSYTGLDRGLKGRKIPPLNAEQENYVEEILNEVFGIVIAKPGITANTFTGSSDIKGINYCSDLIGVCPSCHVGTCVGQNDAKQDALNGMSYTEILDKYIDGDYELINITEGLYFQTTNNYNGQFNLNESFHFYQTDYKGSNSFCEGGTISARGCSVASTAIAVSLLTNQRHDPLQISSMLKSSGGCTGNRVTYPAKAAELFNLNSYTIREQDEAGINRMLADLATGNSIVVARLDKNNGRYKTTSGHYIALVGVRTINGNVQVLVWDPAGKNNPQRDNYWADFNSDIQKYVNDPAYVVLSRR